MNSQDPLDAKEEKTRARYWMILGVFISGHAVLEETCEH
jgi:hypothetical protein